jgi:CRP/FNR family transcriptional regulator
MHYTVNAMLDPAELLRRSPVLGLLAREEREDLVRAGRVQVIADGTDLFLVGDLTEAIQVLLEGRVRLWRLTADGHVLVLRICQAGEILGQMSALEEEGRHSVNATAVEGCRVLKIPASAFKDLLSRRPELAIRLASVLAQRVRALSDELEAMKFASIGQRVLRWLREHGARMREIRTTHQEIAQQVGATRENVSRVLGLLRDRGILRLGRGSIEILDHGRLEGEEVY